MKLARVFPVQPPFDEPTMYAPLPTWTPWRGATSPRGGVPRSPSDEQVPAVARAPAERLFESLRPDLVRFARWLTRDQAIAEDVVQEALLRAWRSRDALKERGAARAWLLTIVRREHARLFERKRLTLVPLDQDLAASVPAEPEDELAMLRHAIMQLPLQYREPLVMQVLGGFSIAEIARELALSGTAVLTRLHRARNRLRVLCGTQAPATSHG